MQMKKVQLQLISILKTNNLNFSSKNNKYNNTKIIG